MTQARSRRRARREPLIVDRQAPDFTLEGVVEAMLPEYLQCRDLGHTWRPQTVRTVRPRGGAAYIDRVFKCRSCRCVRTQSVDPGSGIVLDNKYNHEAGYKVVGLGRIEGHERGLFRLANTQRMEVSLAG